MSDTPLTDKFASTPRGLGVGYYDALQFAQGLESRLHDAKQYIEALEQQISTGVSQLASLTEENAKLKEIAKEARYHLYTKQDADRVRGMAEEYLAALKDHSALGLHNAGEKE